MVEKGLTRRDALARAGKVAFGGALLAVPLGGVIAKPAEASHGCAESVQDIIDIAAVAEALATTFYYYGVTRRVGTLLDEDDLDYFRAALAQEKNHLDLLRNAGAAPPPRTFFFDPATFGSVKEFTRVLLALETAFIGAYAAAVQRFGELGRSDLARLAARILGIEAEHRVLGRDVAGTSPPNNLCLERAPYKCVSGAADDLAPFLSKGPGRRAFRMPSEAKITAEAIPCK